MSKVLVTGGSGFVGAHVILQLVSAGHQVRTTVRNLNRESAVRAMLKAGGQEAGDSLSFVTGDLENDAGWREAAAGCDYVMHVASPIPVNAPKLEDDLIVPAREGTLRVLRAARKRYACCADLVLRGDLLRSSAAERAVRRNQLDDPE